MREPYPSSRLDQVARIRRGASPRPKGDPRYFGGDIPWLKIGDVPPGSRYVSRTEEAVTEAGKNRSVYVEVGTLLLSNSASVGRPVITKMGACIHDGWLAIDNLKEEINQDFLYWVLISSQKHLEKLAPTGTQRNLNIGLVSAFQIPVPPLPEQECIVATLDAVEELRRLREQADRCTGDLIPAIFHEMFGDPATNPKGWNMSRLGDVTCIDALMVDPRQEEYRNLPHVGAEQIIKKTGELLPTKTAAEDMLISGKYLFDAQHVLYSKIRPYLRKAALVEGQGLCSADVYPVHPDKSKMTREFLWSVLLSDSFTDYTTTVSTRANMPKINRKQFEAYEIILPPLSFQYDYTARVAEIRAMQAQQAQSRDLLDNLFKSLLHNAFFGDL